MMHMTDFERGTRSPDEFLEARYAYQKARSKRDRKPPLTPAEKQARRELAIKAVARLDEHQKVAERLGIHATAVTRWVNGRTVVPARHLPGLRAILAGR